MKCKYCNKEIDNDSIFCEYCGTRIKIKCESCRNMILIDSLFCKHCGAKQTTIFRHVEYVDLGLPSGTKWETTNRNNKKEDHGFFTYDEVMGNNYLFSGGGKLPTKDQFQELIDNCTWAWNFSRNGMDIIGKNGNMIFMPAMGFRKDSVFGVGSTGMYWSSTPYGLDTAWFLTFSKSVTTPDIEIFRDNQCYGKSLRLVHTPKA